MRKIQYILTSVAVLLAMALSSCSENLNEVEEYPDWQSTNESYFSNIYTTAKNSIAAGGDNWKIFRGFSLNEDIATHDYNHIVVEVLEEGTGSGCPLYTDSVKVHYLGRLLPSTSYTSGYVFAQSYYGDYNPNTASPVNLAVATNTYTPDGLCTALQQMHIGDRWRIYVPYQLGYGTSTSSTLGIPGYSTLVYELTLVAYYRAGVDVPDSQAKEQGVWIEE